MCSVEQLPTGESAGLVEPLRVLHVYSGNLFGGIERMLLILAEKGPLAAGFEQEFALCFEGALSRGLRRLEAPLHVLPSVRLRRPWSVLAARRALRDVLRRGAFNVVVTHSYWPHAVFAPVAVPLGLPVVLFAHDAVVAQHWTERWASWSPPELVLSNSHYTTETVARLFPDAPIETYRAPVLPPALEHRAALRAKLRGELSADPSDCVILLASRLERYKGHVLLLDALGRLTDIPGWKCWITSSAQRPHERAYLGELRLLVERLALSHRVQFLGDRPDAGDLMLAADVHCQPNVAPEPFGRVFVEALYAGLTVVTTDLGGAAEILREDRHCWGVLVPPNDPLALASALARAIQDAALRQLCALEGPQRADMLCGVSHSLARLCELLLLVSKNRDAAAGVLQRAAQANA